MFGTQTFFSTPSLFMEVGGQRNITNIYSDNSNTMSFFIPIKSPFPLEKMFGFYTLYPGRVQSICICLKFNFISKILVDV